MSIVKTIKQQRAEFIVALITASCPGREAAKQPQNITLSPPCWTVGMLLELRPSKSPQSTEYFAKSLGDHQDVWVFVCFLTNVKRACATFFSLELSHGYIYFPSPLLLKREH